MPRCLVSFGANIGDPAETIRAALVSLKSRLSVDGDCQVELSRFFKTPPVGGPSGQPPFVNAVAAIESQHSVWEHWAAVRAVESEFGRERNLRWEARKLDLDILLYDNMRIWTPQFKVPHPRMCMRRFILEPACDVAADWLDPVSGMTIRSLTSRLRGQPGCIHLYHHRSVPGVRIATSVAEVSGAKVTSASGAEAGPLRGAARELRLQQADSDEVSGLLATDANITNGLVVYLPQPVGEKLGAWEDIHRDAAVALQMQAADEQVLDRWLGPRYLLASDDESWAIHEINAAFEAMDCPIEPIAVDA
ncbi:MAG: 2-amino-4-hydroxy-6-hydroxymethyldihydropteridine diphosphokinase [Planctomycetota bacterium]